jgi:hypothetical protein
MPAYILSRPYYYYTTRTVEGPVKFPIVYQWGTSKIDPYIFIHVATLKEVGNILYPKSQKQSTGTGNTGIITHCTH